MPHDSSSETLLRERLASLPHHLRAVGERVSASASMPLAKPAVVTGIGGSEGPARMMAELLRDRWRASASFVPLSAFATGALDASGTSLIVFSQSLSPNARLALAHSPGFDQATLFTSVGDDPALTQFQEHGGRIVRLPPASEQGALVRVVGPCAAMLAAALHAGAASAAELESLLDAIHAASARVPAVDGARPIAFVTAGGYGELCRTVRNLWLEALCVPEPPMWDVLEVAHGPFQQFFDAEVVLVALERDGDERLLFDRLAQMLVPDRHTLVRLRSSVTRALAPIDHVAQIAELVCRELARSPRNLGVWPGCGRDAPVYGIGPGWQVVEPEG